ncbi:MAG TPA: AAA family ATPase [Candidatus Limnocylindrales bacterium]|nr:AAA family ATPase [Candidatus Limnocylindrales bacterium]
MEGLIGRAAELERIDAALARHDALPAGVLLHGEAGMGKTMLWLEGVRRAQSQGFRVLQCALTVHESGLAFAGLADLIGPSLDEVIPALPAPQAIALEAALARRSAGASPFDERAVAFALHAALSSLARRAPIVVAIDDVQWLDRSSALMLAYATRRLRSEPVLLLFAERAGEPTADAQSLPRGSGVEVERIHVGPLPMGALHRIIRTRLGFSLTRPQLLTVTTKSDGNPLHALELARSIGPGGTMGGDGLAGLLADRIAVLPDRVRDALALAAITTEPDVELLSSAIGTPLRRDLRPALEADLVRIAAGQVRFTHPLIAAAAEASVPDGRRAALHRRLAGVARSPEVRAAHLERAADAPDAAVADALDEAARSAHRRGARAASASLYEGAGRLTLSDDPERRAQRFLAAAAAWYEAGDGPHAEVILTALLEQLPRGDQRCEAAWQLGVIRDEVGQWKEAIDLWRAALADTEDGRLRSRILCSLTITALYTGSVDDAIRLSMDAVDAAERTADPAHLARALAIRAFIMTMSGTPGHEMIIERALTLEADLDESLGDWSPAAIAAECARHTGDVAAARRHYETVLQRAADAGDANQEQWAAFGLASTVLLTGEFRRASELADAVLDLADQTGQMRIPARSLRAHVDTYLGNLDAARRLVDEAMAAARAADETTHLFGTYVVLALIELFAGHDAAAADAYASARRIAQDTGLRHATVLRVLLAEAEAAASSGRAEQADSALAAFDDASGGSPPTWCVELLHRARAAVHAADGRLREADLELSAALSIEASAPFDRARTLLAAGTLARRLREHNRARMELERALAAFTALGVPAWVERTRLELGRIPGRRAARGDELTEAESRIAELVAAGRSNKEVAAALFLSVKTVEVTLTRVYGKVGVRSRAELAHRLGAVAKQ